MVRRLAYPHDAFALVGGRFDGLALQAGVRLDLPRIEKPL
jgi:hypothetical protein